MIDTIMSWVLLLLVLALVVSGIACIAHRAWIRLLVFWTFLGGAFGILSYSSGAWDVPEEGTQADSENYNQSLSAEENPSTENEPINWSPIVFGLGALLTVGALGGGGFITYQGVKASKTARRKKREKAEREATKKKETIRCWDSMRNTYENVVSRYAGYETDIWKALKYPAMHDVNVQETSDFLKQLRISTNYLKEQENTETGTIGGTEELYQKLFKEMNVLEGLFESAEKNALKMQWKFLPQDEKKDLKRAVQLLKHAESEGNSPVARKTYYDQLQKVVDRLNSRHAKDLIPTATVKALSSGKETLLLTDGSSNNSIDIDSFLKDQVEINETETILKDNFFKNRFKKIREKVPF